MSGPRKRPDGIYDNMATGRREVWKDGTRVHEVSAAVVIGAHLQPSGDLEHPWGHYADPPVEAAE